MAPSDPVVSYQQSSSAHGGKKEAHGIVKGAAKGGADPAATPTGDSLTDWEVLKEVYAYIKPAGASKEFRQRASAALGLLIASKLLSVQVPFIFKYTSEFEFNIIAAVLRDA